MYFCSKNLKITRDLIINQDHIFGKCYVYLAEGKKIIVNAGINLTICNSIVNSCDNFWNNIELMAGANLYIDNSSINQAEHVTTSLGANTIEFSNKTKIQSCQNGITCSTGSSGSSILLSDSEFDGLSGYIAKVIDAELFESVNTQYANCFGGIGLSNSDAKVKGSNFYGIGNGYRGVPEVTSPWRGTAIYSSGGNGKKLETIKDPDPHAPQNDFKDFNCAIYNSGTAYDFQGNNMSNGEYGIYIGYSGSTTGGLIHQNEIEVAFLGINLDQNGAMPCTITKNKVSCTSTYGTAIQIGGNSGLVLIEDNEVTNETGQAGILANTCSNVDIKNNTVYTNATNGVRTDGIYLLNSMNCTLTCNKVSCAAYGNGTSAVEVQESPFNTVSCNEIEGADCGLVFAGSCNPNEVSENFLGNHKLGLVLVTRATGGDGIIGPQSHRGNHLTGCGIDKDAVNYGTAPVVQQSQFLVTPSSPYLPNNIQELVQQQWFLQPESGVEYSCSVSNLCPDGFGDRSSDKNFVFHLYHQIFNSTIGLNDFDDARTWSARKNVLEFIKYKKYPSEEENRWIRKYENTHLGLFSNIGIFLNTIGFNPRHIDEIKFDFFTNVLNHLSHLSIFEQTQKEVSLIRLKYLKNMYSLELTDYEKLATIAHSCPYEYGNAVYEARMLLGNVKPALVNEIDLCDAEIGELVKEREEKAILIYPNPSNDIIHIKLVGFNGEKVITGRLEDICGKTILNIALYQKTELLINELETGLYFMSIDGHPELVTKVIIQR